MYAPSLQSEISQGTGASLTGIFGMVGSLSKAPLDDIQNKANPSRVDF